VWPGLGQVYDEREVETQGCGLATLSAGPADALRCCAFAFTSVSAPPGCVYVHHRLGKDKTEKLKILKKSKKKSVFFQ
jgi:hypothetical protein